MEKIERFDKGNMKMLREEIEAVLDFIYNDYGVKLEIGNITYSGEKFTTRLTGYAGAPAEKEKLERKADQAEKDFGILSLLYGLAPDDLGKTFAASGHIWKIKGIKAKSKKYPILCSREDGKMFKFSASTVLIGLGKKKGGY